MSGLEIISKGNFEVMAQADNVDDRPPSSRSSTSLGIRADSGHLSLEYLTPEEPHYGGSQHQLALEPSPGAEESERPADGLDSSELYSRIAIQELSEKIHTLKMELGELEDRESLKSGLKLLEGAEDEEPSGRTPSAASGSSDDYSSAVVRDEGLGTTAAQDSHAEAAGGKKTESFSGLESVAADRDGVSTLQGPSPSHSSHSGATVSKGESQRPTWDHPQADPKLQRAFEKMKKLDTKLADLIKKEKEVKRQRKLLEQQMENEGSTGSSRALVALETGENTPPTSPVFHTQLEENCSNAGDYPSGSTQQEDGLNEDQETHTEADRESTKPNPRQSQERHGGVDYIKRNIELASEASAPLAMTEAERKRLEELLEDDELEDPYASPPALPGIPGVPSGFQYSDQEEERMRDIDSRLQALMPAEDWQSMCSSSRMTTPATMTQALPDESYSTTSVSDTGTPTENIETSKHIGPGEEVLQQFQVSREESQKLKEIEEQLSAIWEEKAREAEALPALPASQLQALVEQCKRELSTQQNPTTQDGSCNQLEDGSETEIRY